MPASVTELVELLDLEKLEEGLFRGGQPVNSSMTRVYGGQVAAQALVAAQRTVSGERHVHSAHVYFILGGDPSIPIVYDVDDVRDGGSFSTRRVAARQHGEIIFYMTASFQKDEDGWDHQDAKPDVPEPAQCTPLSTLIAGRGDEAKRLWEQEWASVDMRYVGDARTADDPTRQVSPACERLWFRVNGEINDDPVMHTSILAYFSDLTLLGSTLTPHGVMIHSDQVQPASLDHAIWFHRPVRVDEWLLYDQFSPSASGARGLAIGRIFSYSGTLVATVAQEGLIRPVQHRPTPHGIRPADTDQ